MGQTLTLRLGDCVHVLQGMPEGSLGAVVSDPPYGLEFMGKSWDRLDWTDGGGMMSVGMGGREIPWPSYSGTGAAGTANATCAVCGGRMRGAKTCSCDKPDWRIKGKPLDLSANAERMRKQQESHRMWLTEAYRALKPGGVIKAFSGSRTFHRLGAAMAEVGFTGLRLEAWTYGSGFPKSHDVSKAIDKAAGADREKQAGIQAYLKQKRKELGLSKAEVDRQVFGGTTRYAWVEGRGGARSNEVYLPTPEEWVVLKECLQLDDRYDSYIKQAIPSREDRFRADGGKGALVAEIEGDWGYQKSGERWGGTRKITAPRSAEAQQWDGWGTALKPAWEPVIVGRKSCG